MTCPKGSAMNDDPQNSSPLSDGPSKPMRLTAANIDPVRDSMCALNRAPGIELGSAILLFF